MKNLTRRLLILFALVLGFAPALQAAPADRYAAIARALSECGHNDAKTNWCRNAWIALAISDKSPGGWGSAWGPTPEAARKAARRECLARNPDARVVACVSAYGD
jgi:hypothetical protein